MLAVTLMNQKPTAEQPIVVAPDDAVEQLVPELAAINIAIDPGNTLIDEQLDVLALRVDLASTEDTWGDDGLSTSDRIDRAVARFEIDQFNDDATPLLADEPALF